MKRLVRIHTFNNQIAWKGTLFSLVSCQINLVCYFLNSCDIASTNVKLRHNNVHMFIIYIEVFLNPFQTTKRRGICICFISYFAISFILLLYTSAKSLNSLSNCCDAKKRLLRLIYLQLIHTLS